MFDWISGFMQQTGYFGIAFLMFAENVFPPIPSELIMPLAGFTAARGDMSLTLIVIAGTIGSLAGALFWYGIGRLVGTKRLKAFAAKHGRWLTLSPRDIDRTNQWFDRHGGKAVLIGRLVPAVRSLISVPAGIAHMPVITLLIYSSIGTGIWTAFLALSGYWLGEQHESVQRFLNPVSNVVIVGLVAFYIYRVVTFRPEKS